MQQKIPFDVLHYERKKYNLVSRFYKKTWEVLNTKPSNI